MLKKESTCFPSPEPLVRVKKSVLCKMMHGNGLAATPKSQRRRLNCTHNKYGMSCFVFVEHIAFQSSFVRAEKEPCFCRFS